MPGGPQAQHRRDVDDAAAASPLHDLDGELAADEGALEVEAHRIAEYLRLDVLDGAGAGAPGVVDQHVQSAEAFLHGVHHALPVLLVARIVVQADRLSADPRGHGLDTGLVDVRGDHGRAFAREGLCGGRADAVARSGDDRDAPCQSAHGIPLSSDSAA